PTLDLFFHHLAHRALRGKVAPEQEITGSLHIRKRRPQGAAVLRWGSPKRTGTDRAGEVELRGVARLAGVAMAIHPWRCVELRLASRELPAWFAVGLS